MSGARLVAEHSQPCSNPTRPAESGFRCEFRLPFRNRLSEPPCCQQLPAAVESGDNSGKSAGQDRSDPRFAERAFEPAHHVRGRSCLGQMSVRVMSPNTTSSTTNSLAKETTCH